MEKSNKRYKYYSVNTQRITQLSDLSGSYNKGLLLDKIAFLSINSTLKLPGSSIQEGWFSVPYEKLAKMLCISLRTINSHIKALEERGLIEKVRKKFNNTTRAFIRLTPKTYLQLGYEDKVEMKPKNVRETTESKNLEQNCTLRNAELACSYIEVKELENTNNNSTVRQACIVNNLKTTPINPKTEQPQSYAIEKTIGEQLEPRLKNYIKGMLTNIQTQHDIQISNPEQLFAEVVFSVLNKENQMVGVEDSHHRVNIIAKLLRSRLWTTPKGFYNHWEVGQLFQHKRKTKEYLYQKQKIADMSQEAGGYDAPKEEQHLSFSSQKPAGNPYEQNIEVKKHQNLLRTLTIEINSEKNYLMQMNANYQKNKDNMTQQLIKNIAVKLEKLYEQQAALNQKLGQSMAA